MAQGNNGTFGGCRPPWGCWLENQWPSGFARSKPGPGARRPKPSPRPAGRSTAMEKLPEHTKGEDPGIRGADQRFGRYDVNPTGVAVFLVFAIFTIAQGQSTVTPKEFHPQARTWTREGDQRVAATHPTDQIGPHDGSPTAAPEQSDRGEATSTEASQTADRHLSGLIMQRPSTRRTPPLHWRQLVRSNNVAATLQGALRAAPVYAGPSGPLAVCGLL